MSGTTFASTIKSMYKNAVRKKCCDKGCSLRVDVSNTVILKGEEMEKQAKICDCIIFLDGKKIIMAELKSSSLRASDILEQLTNGGKKALEIAAKVGMDNIDMYFVLAAQDYRNYLEVEKLDQGRVKMGNQTYSIRRWNCRDSISKAWN